MKWSFEANRRVLRALGKKTMAKTTKSRGLISAACLVILCTCGHLAAQYRPPSPPYRRPSSSYLPSVSAPTATADASNRFASMCKQYETASKGMVKVLGRARLGPPRFASGFFVSKDGLIVTNWHVIANPHLSSVVIEIQGVKLGASVLAVDEGSDLAILKTTEAMTVPHTFGLRTQPPPSRLEKVYALGHASLVRLSFSTGGVMGVLSSDQAAATAGKGVRLGHAQYIRTDATIDAGNIGGPLLDAKGQVIGMCALRSADGTGGCAVDAKAINALLTRAAKARPMKLDEIRKRAEACKGEPLPFMPKRARQLDIGRAYNAARKAAYCSRCNGTGKITVTETRRRRVLRTVFQYGQYRKIWVYENYNVDVEKTCTVCDGDMVTRSAAEACRPLGQLAETLMRANLADAVTVHAYWDGLWVLNELAFSDYDYARDLTASAADALRAAQQRSGTATAFAAYVTKIQNVPGGSMVLAVTRQGQPVAVAMPGLAGRLEGQKCLIAGVIRGADGTLPLLGAATIRSVHKVDPKYRSRNPDPLPLALEKLTKPTPVHTPIPPEDKPDPAERLLAKARMYAQNDMKAKAIPILKEILKSHPDSEQAETAREMLARIDPASAGK